METFIASELFVQTGSTKLGEPALFYSQSYLGFWVLLLFFIVCPSTIHLFLLLEKDGLLLPIAHFGPIVNISGVHQMLYNRTQSVSGQLQECVWSSSDTSWMGKWAVTEKGRSNAASMFVLVALRDKTLNG
jgi:hypothetical protein